MVGILVCGDNHFIVRGPRPDSATAHALARHWSIIRIGAVTPPELTRWTITNKEFRENLQWAIVVSDAAPHSRAVLQLLKELAERGILSS